MASRVQIIISASASAAVATFRAVSAAIQRVASSAGKVAPYALMAGKVLVAVAAVTALTGVLGNLLGAIQLIAPAAAAGGLALLGLKLAMNGVQDALDAGLSGDTEKFEKALKKLAPQAADTVRALVRLRDTWKPLQKDFQGRVFEGAAGELEGLSKFIKPIADRWLPKLAMRFAEVRHEIADGIARYAADGRLEKVWENVHGAVSNLMLAIKPLARAFGDVLEVASPHLKEITGGVGAAAQKFADWVREMKNTGKLDEWLNKAREGFGTLKEILTNVGLAVKGLMTGSAEGGKSTLENIADHTERLSNWVNSGDGQAMIEMWSKIADAISKSEPMLRVVLYFIGLTGDAWRMMGVLVTGVWDGIKAVVAGAIGWILGGYEKVMRAAAAAADAMGMDGLAAKLRGAADKVAGFAGEVNNYINGIQKTVNITVTTHYKQVGRPSTSGDRPVSGSGLRFNHSGGHPRGLSWVGEYGPELVDFGAQGRVYNNGQSMAMASGGGVGQVNLALTVAPGGSSTDRAMGALAAEAVRRGWVQLIDSNGKRVRVA